MERDASLVTSELHSQHWLPYSPIHHYGREYDRVSLSILEDPKSQDLDYRWCDVGVLDYDEEKKLYLVQKTDDRGLVRDEMGMPIVNGGVTPNGNKLCTFPSPPGRGGGRPS